MLAIARTAPTIVAATMEAPAGCVEIPYHLANRFVLFL